MELNNSLKNIRLEEELLLCCSRMNIDLERADQIGVLLRKDIDWSYLTQMALRHGLMPLLYRNLKATTPDAIPEEILEQLRKYFLVNAGRNIFLTEELHRLLHLFESHGIVGVPYKGPVLAASIYGDVTLRQFSDLDILIQKKDLKRARDLIIPLGYQPHINLTDADITHYIQFQNELSFMRQDGRVAVELQWEITPHYFNFPIPSKYLWESIERSPKKDSGFRVLPSDIELIVMCVHGTKDRWTRLLWVCDVAELIRANGRLDWDWILTLSNTLGCSRMLFLGLYLTKDLLDTSIPVEVMKQIESDPMVKRLAKQVRQQLFNGYNGSSSILKNSLFYLKTREHLRDKIQYCLRLATGITPGDWTFFPLANSLFPIYYLIRPFRLALKYGLKSLGSIYPVRKPRCLQRG